MGGRTERGGALTIPAIRFERDDLSRPVVVDLVDLHLRAAFANSPPGSVFALDLSGLRDPAVTLWTAWEGDALLGMGALKRIDATHGEVKSMRTAPAHLRRGVAAVMLAHLIGCARGAGFARLSLETGATDAYAAARTLYERTGFVPCEPFGDYTATACNRYYTCRLDG